MFGAALQAAEAAVDAAASRRPKLLCGVGDVVLKPPGGRSFPASASGWESSWNFGKAEAGRAGAVRGRRDADESAAERASRTSDDRITNVW
jgi:hypothetical protein